MKIGICNVGVGSSHVNGTRRLKESLDHFGVDWKQFFWVDKYPDGCPTHKQSPYGFKAYAMQEAFKAGMEIVIWLDSSMWLRNGNVSGIISQVERDGYYFPNSGYSCGQWCSDNILRAMGVTRTDDLHDASTSPMCMAGFTFLDLRQPRVREFYEEYQFWCKKDNGILLQGKHVNDGSVSSDSRVTGFRHDQSVASLLIKKYGFKVTNSHENFFMYYPYKEYVGNKWKDVKVKADLLESITFFAQGCL